MKLAKTIAILLLPAKLMACGLDWSKPTSFFNGTDYQGNVDIVSKLGEAEKLPIYLVFNSTYGNSDYAGSGFRIPLLESRIWQVDEKRFRMESPSGWLWIFQRTKDPSILEGNAGWKGEIKDDTISLWAPCGDKLLFKNGKIVSMQVKNDKFAYEYKGNRVERILKNGLPILDVKSDDKTGEVTGLRLPNSRQEVGLLQTGSRPKIEKVGGTNVVSRVDKTLEEVTKVDGTKETFEFGVDGKMNPTLKIGERAITWNAATKNIMHDGEWKYDIKVGEGIFENAAIGRTNQKNQSEYWFLDAPKGQETSVGSDGVKKVTTWFTSGILAGSIRNRTETINGKTKTTYQGVYDEKGRIFREVLEHSEVNQYTYDDQGENLVKTCLVKETVSSVEEYKDRKLSTVSCPNGRKLQYFYDDKGRERKVLLNGKLHIEKSYASDGAWEKTVVTDEGAESPSRTFYKEFDAERREVFERNTEHVGDYPEVVKRYFYSADGLIEKIVDSQQGTLLYLVGQDGNRIIKILK